MLSGIRLDFEKCSSHREVAATLKGLSPVSLSYSSRFRYPPPVVVVGNEKCCVIKSPNTFCKNYLIKQHTSYLNKCCRAVARANNFFRVGFLKMGRRFLLCEEAQENVMSRRCGDGTDEFRPKGYPCMTFDEGVFVTAEDFPKDCRKAKTRGEEKVYLLDGETGAPSTFFPMR